MAAKPIPKSPVKTEPKQLVIPFEKRPRPRYPNEHTVGSLLDACLAARGPMGNPK